MGNRREFLKLGAAGAAGLAFSSKVAAGVGHFLSAPAPELEETTIEALRQQLNSGQLSSQQLVEKYLARLQAIDRTGPALRSVIEVNPDAMALARQADSERRNRMMKSPLHGVPVLIKDNIGTADKMMTSAGSLALAATPAAKNSYVAERLIAAGAIILGKANLSEWANFRSTHASSGWSGRGGQTKCPYALDRNPSGSSSGSAAAVSANLCAVSIGSETDGSIVSPACSNGIVGFKPTVGLIGRSGIVPISHTQDTAGPMGRTVADVTALLSVLAGVDPEDAATKDADVHVQADYSKFLDRGGLRGMRLGVLRKYAGFNDRVDALFAEAIAAMKADGAEIIDPVEIANLTKFGDAEQLVLLYEFKADLNAYLAARGSTTQVHSLADVIAFNDRHREQEMPYFGQELMLQAQAKGPLTEPEYVKALADCRRMSRTEGIDAVMDQHNLDALICPTGTPAWLTDLVNGDANEPSSSGIAAVAGYPHITVPMGFDFGLPVGVSFFGRAWSEPALIKIAYAYEQGTNHRKPPRFLATVDMHI